MILLVKLFVSCFGVLLFELLGKISLIDSGFYLLLPLGDLSIFLLDPHFLEFFFSALNLLLLIALHHLVSADNRSL